MPRSTILLILALWTGSLLPALDATLLGTALPTIIGALDGLPLYGWVFAANLLTFTAAIPIFGKLSDIYGRRPVFLGGVSIYLAASTAGGLVQSVEQLILCRALAGIGLGGVMPVTMTVLGDAFPLAQRARIQWVFASSWFLASLAGPAVGSLITLYASWRLVFYAGLPVGIISAVLLLRYYRETVERRRHAIDYRGALLLTTGIVALLLALSPGGRGSTVTPETAWPLLAVSAVLLALFVWNESRFPEPLLPLPLVLSPVVGISLLLSAVSGIVQFGATSFLPLFAQGAQGGNAAHAGAVLAPLTLGWPLGAAVGGRLLLRTGYRNLVLTGMVLVAGAHTGLVALGRETPLPLPMLAMGVMGLGFGFSNVGFIFAVQESVSWSQRGVATASLQFARSVGGSVGVALMAAVVAAQMAPLLAAPGLEAAAGSSSALLDPAARAALAPDALVRLQEGLAGALHLVFIAMGVLAVLGLACGVAFPARVRFVRVNEGGEGEALETGTAAVAAEAPDPR